MITTQASATDGRPAHEARARGGGRAAKERAAGLLRAADAILDADVLLATGAGWSFSEIGLAVYRDNASAKHMLKET